MGRYPRLDRGRRAMRNAVEFLLAVAMLVGLMQTPAGATVSTITSFRPTSGEVGTPVIITGADFHRCDRRRVRGC